MAFRNGSFATFLIICPTSFFLGIVFSLFPYDYPLLWSTTPASESHYNFLESHLRLLHESPPLIPRILHIVIFVGLGGLIMKLYRPSESNMLFDGASLVLYMCGVTVYIANIVKGMRMASAGEYGTVPGSLGEAIEGNAAGTDDEADAYLGREDSLKVLSASNTILALVLVGVLVLQAGQWYAERKEIQEEEAINKKDDEAAAAKKEAALTAAATATGSSTGSPKVTRQTSSGSKKKQ
ncbi:hypothetical protein FQN54_003704 [Arachnomyces sp. PD_36]|nr:hypothetical protein FQN54_003704 [Arachnomyces sp. PD_36]